MSPLKSVGCMHLNLLNGFENSSAAASERPGSGACGSSEPASSLFPSARCRVSICNLFGNACGKQTYSNVCEVVQSEMQEIKICLAAFAAGRMRRGVSPGPCAQPGVEWGAASSLPGGRHTPTCTHAGAASAAGASTVSLSLNKLNLGDTCDFLC